MLPMDWYKLAILSNLSYVRWNDKNSISASNIVNAVVEQERLATSVADTIFKSGSPWVIPSYYPNDSSGFAANVFRRGDEAVLAIRGTEANLIEALPFVGDTGLVDLWGADVSQIGIVGFALDQTVSLFNYIMQLTAPAGQSGVLQLKLQTTIGLDGISPEIDAPFIMVSTTVGAITTDTYFWLEASDSGTGIGAFEGVTELRVTGHSLGGHLAVMAIRLFPDLFDSAVTFNAPGFDPAISRALTDQFVSLFGNFLPTPPAATFGDIASRVTAIESEDSAPGDDASFVASLWTGIPVGEEVLIHTEKNSHSMDQLMDALAVQSLVASLNPDIDLTELLRFYDGSSADAGVTEETIVAALARVILGSEPVLEPVDAGIISHGDFSDRTAIHDQIVSIQQAAEAGGLRLELLWDKSVEQLTELAQTSVAYRYAIQNLDPFVILGDAAAYSQPSTQSLYSDPHGNEYWLARSEMLLAYFDYGVNDGNIGPAPDQLVTFADVSSGIVFETGAAEIDAPEATIFVGDTPTGVDGISGGDGDDRLFGGLGSDRIAGGGGSDYVDGGAGADWLNGSSPGGSDDNAVDRLAGGAGADNYSAGNGDVISDSDRSVAAISVLGMPISGTYVLQEDGTYASTDSGASLTIVGRHALVTVNSLSIAATVTIEDFVGAGLETLDGDFGITLVWPEEQPPPGAIITQVGTAYGDYLRGTEIDDGILGLGGDDDIRTWAGADFVDAGPGDDFVMHATNGSELTDLIGDEFFGGTGDDILIGYAGDDRILGGEGEDSLEGEGGQDLLRGGDDDDVILGGLGDDQIYGDAANDILYGDTGVPLTEEQLSENADRLWGGKGRDRLFGESGPDTLFGDGGSDSLFGGYGDDVVYGGAHGDYLHGDDGSDRLDGGDGSDRLHGGYGDDFLIGGAGDDHLDGQAGLDILSGGGGSDVYEFYTDLEQGWEIIRENIGTPEDVNTIRFQNGNDAIFYRLRQSGDDLLLEDSYGYGGIVVEDWFVDPDSVLDEIAFDDRTWNIADMQAVLAGQGTRWSDNLFGTYGDDWIFAGDGPDYGYGGGGDDVIFGDGGDDQLLGQEGNDRLYGGAGWDLLEGGVGEDLLHAGVHLVPGEKKTLQGGDGSDVYLIDADPGVSVDIFEMDPGGDDVDVLRIGGDVSLSDVAVHRRYMDGQPTSDLIVSWLPEAGGAPAQVRIVNWFAGESWEVERVELANGELLTSADLHARIDSATAGRDSLTGIADTTILFGLAGNDELIGLGARNELDGGPGSDQLRGSGGENLLIGGAGQDQLVIMEGESTLPFGTEPLDILLGGDGRDALASRPNSTLDGAEGITLVGGGSDADTIAVVGGRLTLIAGGTGFDLINGAASSSGDVVVLLNRGDQGDVLASTGTWEAAGTHVLSLGGGIGITDISLRQDGNDLLVLTGALEGIRLQQYFDSEGHPVDWLDFIQIINQSSSGYDATSDLPAKNSPILLIDFHSVLEQFAAAEVTPGIAWELSASAEPIVPDFLTAQAFGGQLVYEYGLLGEHAYEHLGDELWSSLRAVADGSAPAEILVLHTEPVAGVVVGHLVASEDTLFEFTLPENLIVSGLTGDPLPVNLDTTVPDWAQFDPLTRNLSGTPRQEDVGAITLTFSATNESGQSGSTSITLEVVNTNDDPLPSSVLAPVPVVAGKAFVFMLPDGLFLDEDPDDHLVISLSAGGGDAPPEWVTFDPDSGTVSGVPPLSSTGDVNLNIVATDLSGATATTTLTLAVSPPEDPGGETLVGSDSGDNLEGTGGNDSISGESGNDVIDGGGGDDLLDGGDGRDFVTGGTGDDVISGGAGGDLLAGGEGADVLSGDRGSDRIAGGPGDDLLDGGPGRDRLRGDEGNDLLVSHHGKDVLEGGAGDDTYAIRGGAGRVTILEQEGLDVIHFDSSFSSENVRVSQRQDDLSIRFAGTDTRITVADWFSRESAHIESIAFDDGTIMLEREIVQLVQNRARFFAEAVPLHVVPIDHAGVGMPLDTGPERDFEIPGTWQSPQWNIP